MKTTRFLTGIVALLLLLLSGGPAFAFQRRDGGGKGAVRETPAARVPAAVHAVARGGSFHSAGSFREGGGRVYSAPAYSARGGSYSRYSGGSSARGYASHGGYGGGSHYQYAFASHAGWDTGHQYYWHGSHYRWYDGGWVIVDPYPYYDSGYDYPNSYAPNYEESASAPIPVQVQQALSQEGYYNGPIDGIVGPGTSGAIAAYQRDNGLPVTGTITPGLLQFMGIA